MLHESGITRSVQISVAPVHLGTTCKVGETTNVAVVQDSSIGITCFVSSVWFKLFKHVCCPYVISAYENRLQVKSACHSATSSWMMT